MPPDENPAAFKFVYDAMHKAIGDLMHDPRLDALSPDLFFMQAFAVVAHAAASCGVDPTNMLRAHFISGQRGAYLPQVGRAVHHIATNGIGEAP